MTLEVLALGMMETVYFLGTNPEPIARSVLEAFVRRRAASGAPVPTIEQNDALSDASSSDVNAAPASVASAAAGD